MPPAIIARPIGPRKREMPTNTTSISPKAALMPDRMRRKARGGDNCGERAQDHHQRGREGQAGYENERPAEDRGGVGEDEGQVIGGGPQRPEGTASQGGK